MGVRSPRVSFMLEVGDGKLFRYPIVCLDTPIFVVVERTGPEEYSQSLIVSFSDLFSSIDSIENSCIRGGVSTFYLNQLSAWKTLVQFCKTDLL